MKNIIFRTDAGKILNLGTGHLIRCLRIYEYLKKRNKKFNFFFLIKTTNKFYLGKKILEEKKIKFIKLNENIIDYSTREAEIINKLKPNTIILDRLTEPNKKFFSKLSEKIKVVLIENNLKKFRDFNKINLAINPLIHIKKKNKKIFSGFQYNIISNDLFNLLKKKIIKNIFVSFGGYDYKNLYKLIEPIIKNNHDYNFFLNIKLKKKFYKYKNVKFFNHTNYYNVKNKCELAIISGGITLIESIYMGIFSLSVPQYFHQFQNIKLLEKKSLTKKITFDQSGINSVNHILKNEKKMNKLLKNFKFNQKKFLRQFKGKMILNLIEKIIKK